MCVCVCLDISPVLVTFLSQRHKTGWHDRGVWRGKAAHCHGDQKEEGEAGDEIILTDHTASDMHFQNKSHLPTGSQLYCSHESLMF